MSTTNSNKKQKFTLDDRYKEFLRKNAKSKDSLSNPANLFDDSNQEDNLWLNITLKYLSMRSRAH